MVMLTYKLTHTLLDIVPSTPTLVRCTLKGVSTMWPTNTLDRLCHVVNFKLTWKFKINTVTLYPCWYWRRCNPGCTGSGVPKLIHASGRWYPSFYYWKLYPSLDKEECTQACTSRGYLSIYYQGCTQTCTRGNVLKLVLGGVYLWLY